MIRLIEKKKEGYRPYTKKMRDMKPLEVCVVVETSAISPGTVVMRTSSVCTFEVMDLSDPRPSSCWNDLSDIVVRSLFPGEKYLLELS